MLPILLLIAGGVILLMSTNGVSGTVSAAIDSAVDWTRDAAFAAALPGNLRPWAPNLLSAARKFGVSPWLLAGIAYRESSGGSALTPPGPAGTGDFYKRPSGRRYPSGYVVGTSGMPEDGQGWGRGLMQIDWAVWYPWAQQNAWWDPQVNIEKSAEILANQISFFSSNPTSSTVSVDAWRLTGLKSADGKTIVDGWTQKYGITNLGPYLDPRPLYGTNLAMAALAAYNAGAGGVLQAVAAGLTPDAPTARNDYANWIATRASSWLAQFV